MPVSNPIRFVDLGTLDFATDTELQDVESDVISNTQALLNLSSVFAPVDHGHSYAAVNHSHSYAAVSHNHVVSRFAGGSGASRGSFRVRRNSNTTSGEVSVLDTDGRCKYLYWTGSYYGLQVDNVWTGLYVDVSDNRMKENIEVKDSPALWRASLSGLLRIPLVSFDWGEDTIFEGHVPLGVIAQDLEPINPYLVNEDPDGFKHVNVHGCIVQLVAAVKGLNAKVEALEARLKVAGI